MITEADTCRKYFLPKLYAAGWNDDQISEQKSFTDGRIITDWDAAGWRPSQGDLDRYGRTIPDAEYHTVDFERAVALKARTEAIARNFTDFFKKN